MAICAKCGSDRVKIVGQFNTKPAVIVVRCPKCGHSSTVARDRAPARADTPIARRRTDRIG